jgi:hypothetical protein
VSAVHILPGPNLCTPVGPLERHWCFRCRRHTMHRPVALSDSEPSYYGPVLSLVCLRCGEDHTVFPS